MSDEPQKAIRYGSREHKYEGPVSTYGRDWNKCPMCGEETLEPRYNRNLLGIHSSDMLCSKCGHFFPTPCL
eukprot:g50670.t1